MYRVAALILSALAACLPYATVATADESSTSEATRATAIEALALAKARQAAWTTLVATSADEVNEARTELRDIRNAPARGRDEATRKANEAKTRQAENKLQLTRARKSQIVLLAKNEDLDVMQAAMAGAEALLEASEYAASVAKSKQVAETYAKLLNEAKSRTAAADEANEVDKEGRTPLHHAALEANVTQAKRALAAGTQVNKTDNDGFTALHLAAWLGSTDVAKALLEAKADATLPAPRSPLSGDPLGASKVSNCPLTSPNALHLASYAGRGAVVEILLKHGADPKVVLGFRDTGAG